MHREGTLRAAERVAQRAEAAVDRAAAQLAATGPITGRARSADGAVTVVVSPGGVLRDVRLTRAALHRGAVPLAREIVALAAVATRRAAGRVHGAVSAVLDPETGRALAGLGLPPEPEQEEPR